jgi:hypothetical protein
MMMVPNIFGGVEPMFGETEPKFGRARLPSDLKVTNREFGWCDQIVRVGRLTRRARTRVRQLIDLNLFGQLGTFSIQTWHTLGQRLGAFMGFDQMQRQHPSRASGKPDSRSGASPHQIGSVQMLRPRAFWASGKYLGRAGASPYQDLTITKTFVTCFKFLIVSL